MKKPLPVKIVEAIGWVYIALAVLLLFRAVIELPSVPATESICIGICFLVPTLLAVGMLVSLRRRRRGWFVVPNTMLLSLLVAGLALDSLDHASDGLVLACVVSSLFLIVPLVLLYLPSSTLWFKEKTEDVAESNGCLSCLVAFATFLITVALFAIVFSPARGRMIPGMANVILTQGKDLSLCMAYNNTAHESGEEWLDIFSCTNSTQFVLLLREKYGKELRNGNIYTNIWCIAVNPPADDSFPLLFTCNIDPRELLSQTEVDRSLTLTCPKTWGGTSLRICKKMAVIVRAGGAAQIVRNIYLSPNRIFPDGIPKPGPDTYFLTPTGRVDFVERHTQPGTDPAEPL